MKTIFKMASLLAAAAMLFSCKAPQGDSGTDPVHELILTVDKNVIQTFGGDYATLTASYGDKDVTREVVFYDGKNTPIVLENGRFSTDKAGEYTIWANYGASNSSTVTITAVSVTIPATPADPSPASTDFKSRILVSQFTTTGCSPCVSMKSILHEVMENQDIMDKVVFTACHSGLVNSVKDPAFIKTSYDGFASFTGFPYLFCDMYYGTALMKGWGATEITSIFNQVYDSKQNPAGIAVNAVHENGEVVAKVTVKAAATSNYRVGAFILEDEVYAKYTYATEDWMNTGDGVIRYIDAQDGDNFYGYSLGKIEKGQAKDYLFTWNLEDIWTKGNDAARKNSAGSWEPFVVDNLHLAVFVSSIANDGGEEYYRISNVVDVPINGKSPFEYR